MTEEIKDALDLLRAARDAETPTGLDRILEAVRSHLGMQVAYVSEFVGDRTYFRAVDAPGLEQVIKAGDSMSLDDVYCRHILEGRLPEIIPDTAELPFAQGVPLTQAMGIKAHISVPLKLADGRTYGMFCCVSTQPEPSLNSRDLKIMRAFAELTALQIGQDLAAKAEQKATEQQVRRVLDADELSIVLQPIRSLRDDRILGFECLSRFAGPEGYPPDVWFAKAESVGLGLELELRAVARGLALLSRLPSRFYLTLNVAPATIVSAALASMLSAVDGPRVVLEITEHATVEDYDALKLALVKLRGAGVRLAVDDAGAGYASLRHILALQPDIIKLDISLTRNIHADPARNALAAALVQFARQTACVILAEGVEDQRELGALQKLGINCAQGYHLGRPMPVEQALAAANLQEDVRGRRLAAPPRTA
ncbi:EAL domain-containing protein [Devosia sp. RR2S18]|uniref:sensor domain-containing phosphodiesterase n=1 Tax=Devosia rhizosphaerae TaxID=3049774 RepID=UPI002541B3A5|nr:EAL domain-containing protein [Devosia sp. RR2S18]WIJ23903.1 EAL domain-containing protein [Devosia sp. RR2S18]